MAPHSSTLAWKIPWTEEPGRLQSMGSRRVGHNWETSLSLFLSCTGEGNGNPLQYSFFFFHSSILAWRIPGTGKPGGLPSMGSHRVGHDWSDLAAAARVHCVVVSSLHMCLGTCIMSSSSRATNAFNKISHFPFVKMHLSFTMLHIACSECLWDPFYNLEYLGSTGVCPVLVMICARKTA